MRIFLKNKNIINSYKYLAYIIQYAVEKNNLGIDSISKHSVKKIIFKYHQLCEEFKNRYVIGQLDTFKRAACLLVAINQCKLFYNKNEKDIGTKYIPENKVVNVSIDAAFKMIEKPYWFIGEKSDIPYKLNKVDFDRMFAEDSTLLNGRQMLMDSINFDAKNYLSYADTLQLWHYTASIRDGIVPEWT